MATLLDLTNLALWRLRQNGVNFGGAPNQQTTDFDPPYLLTMLLNMGYSEFLNATMEAMPTVVKVSFPTVANATSYALRPLPPPSAGLIVRPNPAAMRVLEATYTTSAGTNAGYEYAIDLLNTKQFAALAGDYTRRLSYFGPRVLYAARLYRRPQLDVLPGTANAGDTISLTIVPDPHASGTGVSCANGGPLQQPGDEPLFPSEFHMALVEYVVMNACDADDRPDKVQAARANWKSYVDACNLQGATEDGGMPTSIVDVYTAPPILRLG